MATLIRRRTIVRTVLGISLALAITTNAAAGNGWTRVPSPNPGGPSGYTTLYSVDALSASDAWAVGYTYASPVSRTLILRWDGQHWTQVPSPHPDGLNGYNYFNDVFARNAQDAWAVGAFDASGLRTLIARWNGSTWTKVASPNPAAAPASNVLAAVGANSASNAWAVGRVGSGTQLKTLAVRWNGVAWTRVATPNADGPNGRTTLSDVAVLSANDAWAVGGYGTYSNGDYAHTLILHWTGSSWQRVPAPDPGTHANLASISMLSPTSGWAVGWVVEASAVKALILRWNGNTWTRVTSPVSTTVRLGTYSVKATSATNAWAVGQYIPSGDSTYKSFILKWNGTDWSQVSSPNPNPTSTDSTLYSVDATSGTNAWAVGAARVHGGSSGASLIAHCC